MFKKSISMPHTAVIRAAALTDYLDRNGAMICVAYQKDGKMKWVPLDGLILGQFVQECRKRGTMALVYFIQEMVDFVKSQEDHGPVPAMLPTKRKYVEVVEEEPEEDLSYYDDK